jgi:hypothetical protein
MEIFQVTKDRIVHSSKRFITTFLVVIFIALPVFLIVNFMYSNSSFSLFEGLTKDKVLLIGESEHATNITNVTTNIGGRIHNNSDGNIKGSYNNIVNNNTMSKVSNNLTIFFKPNQKDMFNRLNRKLSILQLQVGLIPIILQSY